ncbi:MAG TPA: LysM peptidoglycan-binding domain-containing protein [Kineosporiaceae bacterium]|nr:LysM peptidoglycan-binding domain-containing protein [Kineosporiaceae bacterium]
MTLLPRRRTRDGRGRTLRLVSVAALPLAAPVVVAPVAEAVPSTLSYVVQAGDTLSGIALRFGTDVPTLVRLNKLTDPDVLLAGTTLVVPAPVLRAPAPSPRTVLYTVKPGDTVWDIAARTGTTVAALLAANHLDADARIRPGQVLALPPGAHLPSRPPAPNPKPVAPPVVHVVQPGETVSGIAARYRISAAAIISANRLGKDALIHPGQKLVLPGVRPRPTTAPRPPVTHAYVVQRGDTLSGIALAAGVPLTTVTALNHLSASDVIFPGQRLLLPGPAPAPAAARLAAFSLPASGGTAVRSAAAANRAVLATRAAPSSGEITALVRSSATRYGVDPALALAVAAVESGFDQRRVSSANAIGVMQVVPSSGRWASSLVGRSLDLFDASDNVVAGVAILAALRAAEPEETAVAAYYQGLSSVRERGLYDDTRRYVANVLTLRERFRS